MGGSKFGVGKKIFLNVFESLLLSKAAFIW